MFIIFSKTLTMGKKGDVHGKMLVAEFSDNEELLFHQTVEWLSSRLNSNPIIIKQELKVFNLNLYTRTFINENGNLIYLTAKEFDLLYFLYSHKGQVFTKEQIYDNVWGHGYIIDTKNLTSFIRKLRKKIEPDPDKPIYILTGWGVGYKFNEDKS